jgi:hypothetical protein
VIDVLSFVGCFPFRYVCASAEFVAEKLRAWGFERAVVAPLAAVALKNPFKADLEFTRSLGEFFLPAAVLNPEYPGAEADLEALAAEGARALLYPIPYQGFRAGSIKAARLAKRAIKLGMAVLVSATLEDQRQYPRRIRLNKFAMRDVERLVAAVNDERLILSEFSFGEVKELAGKGAFSVDIGSRGIFGPPFTQLNELAELLGVRRLVAATYYPLKYPAAPLAKALLAGLDLERIFVENPKRLLGL